MGRTSPRWENLLIGTTVGAMLGLAVAGLMGALSLIMWGGPSVTSAVRIRSDTKTPAEVINLASASPSSAPSYPVRPAGVLPQLPTEQAELLPPWANSTWRSVFDDDLAPDVPTPVSPPPLVSKPPVKATSHAQTPTPRAPPQAKTEADSLFF